MSAGFYNPGWARSKGRVGVRIHVHVHMHMCIRMAIAALLRIEFCMALVKPLGGVRVKTRKRKPCGIR